MSGAMITFDVDWAPDFVIDFVATRLIETGIRATWFVTHASSAIERLREHPDLFELGIHPNFLPHSTHGSTPVGVLRHCMDLVPEAVSIRTHSLVQSTPLLAMILEQTPITFDVSLFLPHVSSLQPFRYHWAQRCLLRVPYFWEDDLEMERPAPQWEVRSLLADNGGLKVFNFHPIHVYLNSSSMDAYVELRTQVRSLAQATRADIDRYRQPGSGTKSCFEDLLRSVARSRRSQRICDLRGSGQ
jgi:Polysaccharide deacetylase